MLNRRSFLGTMLAAPAIIRTPGLLMPVKAPLVVGGNQLIPVSHWVETSVLLPRISDGLIYVRNNGAWPITIPGFGTIAPGAEAYYGRGAISWKKDATSSPG